MILLFLNGNKEKDFSHCGNIEVEKLRRRVNLTLSIYATRDFRYHLMMIKVITPYMRHQIMTNDNS